MNKKKSTAKPMLPVQIWGVVIVAAAILVLLLANAPLPGTKAFRNWQEVRYATYKTRLSNLLKDHPRKPEEYRVIVFGSSLTEHAVMADAYFNDRFQNLDKAVKVNRVVYAGAYYEMLEDEHFRKFLLAVKPNLLCLEDQVFLYTPLEDLIWKEPLLTKIHKNYVFKADLLKHRLLPAYFAEPGVDAHIDPATTFNTPHPRADSIISQQDSTHFETVDRDIRRMKKTKYFNETLKTLQEGGTEIAILHLPRPGKIEKNLLSAGKKKERDQLIRQYQEEIGLEFWQFEAYLPFKYYWDISHMNKHGQALYSEWLFTKINAHLNQDR